MTVKITETATCTRKGTAIVNTNSFGCTTVQTSVCGKGPSLSLGSSASEELYSTGGSDLKIVQKQNKKKCSQKSKRFCLETTGLKRLCNARGSDWMILQTSVGKELFVEEVKVCLCRVPSSSLVKTLSCPVIKSHSLQLYVMQCYPL